MKKPSRIQRSQPPPSSPGTGGRASRQRAGGRQASAKWRHAIGQRSTRGASTRATSTRGASECKSGGKLLGSRSTSASRCCAATSQEKQLGITRAVPSAACVARTCSDLLSRRLNRALAWRVVQRATRVVQPATRHVLMPVPLWADFQHVWKLEKDESRVRGWLQAGFLGAVRPPALHPSCSPFWCRLGVV